MSKEQLQEELKVAEAMLNDLKAKQEAATAKWSEMEAQLTTGTAEGTALMTELCSIQQQIDECTTTCQFKRDRLVASGEDEDMGSLFG